jgi:hypothetical protein
MLKAAESEAGEQKDRWSVCFAWKTSAAKDSGV